MKLVIETSDDNRDTVEAVDSMIRECEAYNTVILAPFAGEGVGVLSIEKVSE